jgi:hypothetical protein
MERARHGVSERVRPAARRAAAALGAGLFLAFAVREGRAQLAGLNVGDGAVTVRPGFPRLLADRLADVVDVVDFGADPTGSRDSAPACAAAIASAPSGQAVRLYWPSGTYRLASDCSSAGRIVTADMGAGARVGANFGGSGSGVLYVTRTERMVGRRLFVEMQADRASGEFGETRVIVNNSGGGSGPGAFRQVYTNVSTGHIGDDIASYTNASWKAGAYGNFSGHWMTVVSPPASRADLDAGKVFSVLGIELNVTNNGPDSGGWTEFDSQKGGKETGVPATWSGGMLIQPDTWAPSGSLGGNGQFAYAVFNSFSPNKRVAAPSDPHAPASPNGGYIAKWYTGMEIGNDAVAPSGRAIYTGGNTTGNATLDPYSALEARHNWRTGLRLERAVLGDRNALVVAPGDAIQWGAAADGSATLRLAADSAGLRIGGHVVSAGAPPTVTACGGTPRIDGNDTAGHIKVGGGGVTSCSVSFAQHYSAAPYCVSNALTAKGIPTAVAPAAVSAAGVTFVMATPAGGGDITYHCLQ